MDVFLSTTFCIEIPVSSVDLDQTSHSVASKQGLHCLYITTKQISSLKGVKM